MGKELGTIMIEREHFDFIISAKEFERFLCVDLLQRVFFYGLLNVVLRLSWFWLLLFWLRLKY
jgi:hypothetical protein